MILGHQIKLDPDNLQRTYFAKACGIARFSYNWALERWNKRSEAKQKVSEGQLRRELNAIKREEFPWMLEVTKCAPQLSIMALGEAFKRFNEGISGHPKFKRKWCHDSFSISNDQFVVRNKKIRIPNLGFVRMKEKLRFDGKILGATISRIADEWYVSIKVEFPDPLPIHNNESQAVGVDLGIKDLAILDDGTKITGAKPHKAMLHRLRRLNKSISRKQGFKKGEKKSKNFAEAKKKLSKLHRKIVNIRTDQTHKLTNMLTKEYGVIGIENLNVSRMVKNHKLARAIMDMSFFELRRQLEYKSKITGSTVVIADRFFPSSKLCSVCGEKYNDLTLSMREWECPVCHTNHDRDINAAKNLKNLAVSYTVSACGEFLETVSSMKQELNIKIEGLNFKIE